METRVEKIVARRRMMSAGKPGSRSNMICARDDKGRDVDQWALS